MTIESEITCTKCHVAVLSFRLEPPYETTAKRLRSLRVLRNSRIIPSQLYSALPLKYLSLPTFEISLHLMLQLIRASKPSEIICT